jgi:nicotinamide phosphoribosyltransferase
MFHFMMPDVADTYKNCHVDVYPEGMTKLVSYLVPRKSMFEKQQKVVVFGIQAFIKNFKENADAWFAKPTSEVIADYEKKMNLQLGPGNYETSHIEKLHRLGYLPLKIKALPEGSLVNMGVPIASVENTDPDFAWLAQWTECWLQGEVWKPCNDATAGYMYYKIAKKWYDKTTDGADPRMAASDFGMRGMSCMEEACKTSASWLISFNKTSTVPAISWLDYFYNADCSYNHLGIGAVSIEHSVVSSNVAVGTSEKELILKLLKQYKNFSYVADTYDYWDIVKNVLPEIKEEILAHEGKILIRPDSGDQYENVIQTVQSLWETFGGTENKKGYKVLNPHVGMILGDGCTLKQVEKIWKKLEEMKFAATNCLFGVGAFCFHAFFEGDKMIVSTRDTFGFAQKTTYIQLMDGRELEVVKDPKTDTAKLKKSHKGLVFVEKVGNDYVATDGLTEHDYDKLAAAHKDEMQVVFVNGVYFNRQNLMDIRARLAKEVE